MKKIELVGLYDYDESLEDIDESYEAFDDVIELDGVPRKSVVIMNFIITGIFFIIGVVLLAALDFEIAKFFSVPLLLISAACLLSSVKDLRKYREFMQEYPEYNEDEEW